jgi:hypothetical protein
MNNGIPPVYRSPIYVWVKSEYLDSKNFFRFGSNQPDFDCASWPLGIPLDRNPRTTADPRFLLIDSEFDRCIRIAWQVPWQRSNLRIETHPLRSGANFVIRNIGHWNKDASRYEAIAAFLENQQLLGGSVRQRFALTPFCLIAQHWIEHSSIPAGNARSRAVFDGEIKHTSITLFYTFETFIQECLAWAARGSGLDADTIVASYEHVYNNTRPYDAIPTDPAKFPLVRLVNSLIDWGGIVITARERLQPPSTSGIDVRSWRNVLFESRLQRHLMVAIAAACYGLSAFETTRTKSSLVQAGNSAPTMEQLAPFWLGHVIGGYDHAAACEDLLTDLARRYEQAAGTPADAEAFSTRRRSEAERLIEGALPIPLSDTAPCVESFRWPLFDTSLDDQSILRWRETIQPLLQY